MNSVEKTVIFSQVGSDFTEPGVIAGLLHVETADSVARNGVRVIFSNLSPSAAEKWWLALRCGDKLVLNPVSLPQDYFVTEKLDCARTAEAALIGEKDGRKLAAAYACSSGGNRDAFIAKAISLLSGKTEEKCYYKEKAAELLKIFTENKPFSPLIKAFRESYWVRMIRGDAYFLQGVILRGDKPLYICFAMPEKYMKKRDEIFVYYAPEGKKGYFLAFQDAFTGKAVKPDVNSLLNAS